MRTKDLALAAVVASLGVTVVSCQRDGAPQVTATSTPASAAAASASVSEPATKRDDTMTVAELQDRFAAEPRKLLGEVVKVRGVMHSSHRAVADGGATISLTIVDQPDTSTPSVPCQLDAAFAERAADLAAGDDVVVEGRVIALFGAALESCRYTKR